MKTATIKCVILRQQNLGENDKAIFLYCDEFGKIRVIAKGARKINSRFTGHLQTLNLCEASIYFGPRNIILTEIIASEKRVNLKESLETLSCALQISEVTDSLLFESQSLENLLPLIENSLNHLAISETPALISLGYILKLLDKVGVIPDFHSTKTRLPLKYVKFFEFLRRENFGNIEKISLSKKEHFESFKLISKLIERETEKDFHSFTTLTTPFTPSNLLSKLSN